MLLLGTCQSSILSSYDATLANVVLIQSLVSRSRSVQQTTKLNQLSIKIAVSCSKSDWGKAVTVLQN